MTPSPSLATASSKPRWLKWRSDFLASQVLFLWFKLQLARPSLFSTWDFNDWSRDLCCGYLVTVYLSNPHVAYRYVLCNSCFYRTVIILYLILIQITLALWSWWRSPNFNIVVVLIIWFVGWYSSVHTYQNIIWKNPSVFCIYHDFVETMRWNLVSFDLPIRR